MTLLTEGRSTSKRESGVQWITVVELQMIDVDDEASVRPVNVLNAVIDFSQLLDDLVRPTPRKVELPALAGLHGRGKTPNKII